MPLPRLRRPRSPVHLLRQVAAAALACLALVLALRPPPPGAAPVTTTVPVVVAASDLPAGAALAPGDLTVARFPADTAPAGVVTDVPHLTGAVLASPVRSGEPVTDVRVVGAGLWSAVPAGQVAAPVRLADLAVSSLLRPGDRVDVLATGDVRAGNVAAGDIAAGDATAGAEGGGPAVQVVASGALVLTAPAAAPEDATVSGAPGSDGLLVLAVPPDTAGRLAAAAASATLTVTLGRP